MRHVSKFHLKWCCYQIAFSLSAHFVTQSSVPFEKKNFETRWRKYLVEWGFLWNITKTMSLWSALTIWRSAPESTVAQRALTRQPLLNSPDDFKAINIMRILGKQQQTFHSVSMQSRRDWWILTNRHGFYYSDNQHWRKKNEKSLSPYTQKMYKDQKKKQQKTTTTTTKQQQQQKKHAKV